MPNENDDLWNIFSNINDWVRFADTKAAAVIAGQGAIFALAIPRLLANRTTITHHFWLMVLLGVSLILAALTLLYALKCIIPRLKVGEAKSLIFFGHIAQAFDDAKTYRQFVDRQLLEPDGLRDHLAHQIWSNSIVAWAKYKDSTWALRFFAIGLVLNIIELVIVFVQSVS
jgi:hypothetical protein